MTRTFRLAHVVACWTVSLGMLAASRQAVAAEENPSSPGIYTASPLSDSVDGQTGGARARVPFLLSSPRGVSLSLALTYRGQSGTREAGDDWGIDLPAIERSTAFGPPRYAGDPSLGSRLDAHSVDHFLFGGIPLVPICSVAHSDCPANEKMPTWATEGGGWHYFRAEYESRFLRFFWSPDGRTWRVEYPESGNVEEYGAPLAPTVYAEDDGLEREPSYSPNASNVFRWRLVRRYRQVGGAARNVVVFLWSAPSAQGLRLLRDIYDTPKAGHEGMLCDYAHWTHLEWQNHDFPSVSQAPIWRAVPDKRLLRLDVMSRPSADDALEATRRYHFTYSTDHHRSRLRHVQMEGRCDKPARAQEKVSGSIKVCKPPPPSDCLRLPETTFLYSDEGVSPGFVDVETSPLAAPHVPSSFAAFDLDGDALSDFVEGPVSVPRTGEEQYLYFNKSSDGRSFLEQKAFTKIDAHDFQTNQVLTKDRGISLVGDWQADGLPWVLYGRSVNKPFTFYRPFFELLSRLDPSPLWIWGGDNISASVPSFEEIGDYDADGLLDVAHHEVATSSNPLPWSPSVSHLYFSTRTPEGAIVPFARDGGVHGPAGRTWAAENLFRTMADVNGDGVPDVVLAPKPGTWLPPEFQGVLVLPGDGGGNFGCMRGHGMPCMDSIPSDSHATDLPYRMAGGPTFAELASAVRVHVHDVTGDRLADLVLETADTIKVWINLDGLSFGAGPWQQHPAARDGGVAASNLLFADTNASGTDDLVVVTPKKITAWDLFQTTPGLLESVANALGATTSFVYARTASLDRASQGTARAWTTHLPVPMHVVTDVRTFNAAPGPAHRSRHVSYAYRNPAYDGWQKQFLGFESVSQTTEGDESSPSTETTTRYLVSPCQQAKSEVCGVRDRALDPMRAYAGRPVETLVSDGKGTPLRFVHIDVEPVDVLVGMDDRIVRFGREKQIDTWLYDTAKGPASWVDTTVSDVSDDVDGVPGGRKWTKYPLPKPISVTVPVPKDAVHLRTIYEHDTFGHVTKSTDFGRIEGGPVDRPIVQETPWAQVALEGSWQWGMTSSRTHAFSPKAGEPSEHDRFTRYEYDSEGRLSDAYGELKGSLSVDRHHADPSQAVAPPPASASSDRLVRLAHYTYEALTGMLVQVESPGGGCARTGYDDDFGALPKTHTVFTGGCDQNPLTTTTLYDRGLELVTMTVTPSGAVSRFEYDAFGRLTSAFAPDPKTGAPSTEPSLTREYRLDFPLSRVHVKARDGAGYHESWSFLDSLGETMLALSEADPSKGDKGKWIASGLSLVSAKGLVTRSFDSWFYDGDPEQVPFTTDLTRPSQQAQYDAFGRIVATWSYDQSLTAKRVYHALSEDLWDASDLDPQSPHKGTPTTRAYDGHGRLETVTQTGKIGQSNAISTVVTSYVYQATGELKQLTRVSGGLSFSRSMRFDSFGRKVETLEPNTSSSTSSLLARGPVGFHYAYDDRGLLVGTSDARGCGKNMFYDGAGRLLAEDLSPCVASQPAYSPVDLGTGQGSEGFYRYDASAADPSGSALGLYKGRQTDAFDRGAHTQITVDARGRTSTILRQIAKPGDASADLLSRYAPHVFRQEVGFDDTNRLKRKTTGADVPELLGPDPEHPSEVTFDYSARGVLTNVGSSYGPLLSSAIVGAQGRPESETYGAPEVSFTTTHDYDATTQRLSGYSLSRGARELEHLSFGYEASLLKTIRDDRKKEDWPQGAKPVSRTFGYDDFYRLTSVDYDSGGDAFVSAFAQDVRSRPVLAPKLLPQRVKRQAFDFDALGNLTKTTDDAQDGFFDRSLGELKHDSLWPNRLTGDAASKLSVRYDETGNVIALTVKRDTCADAQGKCSHRFAYDWDEEGQLARARRWDASGAPPVADSEENPAAELRYAYAGGARVVRETRSSGEIPLYSVWIFDSLRLDGAHFEGDYERTTKTESAELAGLARVLVLTEDADHGLSGTRRVFLRFADHLGSTSTVVDYATGELVSKTTYQAYGAVDSDYRTSRWGSVREDVRFSGKEDDAEVGLVYFGARYYVPALGRWLSPDPLAIHALGADLNPYAYVEGAPNLLRDPFGLAPAGCDNLSPGCKSSSGPILGDARGWSNAWDATTTWVGNAASNAGNWVKNAVSDFGDWISGPFKKEAPTPPPPPRGVFGNGASITQTNMVVTGRLDYSAQGIRGMDDVVLALEPEGAFGHESFRTLAEQVAGHSFGPVDRSEYIPMVATAVMSLAQPELMLGSAGVGRIVALDANAVKNLAAIRGLIQEGDQLIVSANVATEVARHGVSAADLASAGIRVGSSPTGASVAATRIADVLRGLGGRGAASASADALNLAEAASSGADVFITADRQILRAFGGTSVMPGTGGTTLHVIGF